MPSYDRIYASSPVLAMPQHAGHQVPFDKPIQPYQASMLSQPMSWHPQQLVPTSILAGRKRSRDEAAVNLDPPEKIVEAPVIKEAEDEWEYGPGMILIKKTTGYVADASSQSGTWVEEKAAEETARKTEAALLAQDHLSQERPSLRSHKSQRLEVTGSINGNPSSRHSSPSRDAVNPMTSSSDSLAQPIVDDFTRILGIGWNRISDDEHIQAAARGWARFIENHYPITNPTIRLESRGLQSYLVVADEGVFLFAENLRQGRLISQTPERAFENLKSSPIVFDGPATMEAAETPFATPSPTAISGEMDMS